MAQNTVEMIIRKAVTDEEFRSLLLNTPDYALSGHDLTDEERTALSKLNRTQFEGDPVVVEERITRTCTPPCLN